MTPFIKSKVLSGLDSSPKESQIRDEIADVVTVPAVMEDMVFEIIKAEGIAAHDRHYHGNNAEIHFSVSNIAELAKVHRAIGRLEGLASGHLQQEREPKKPGIELAIAEKGGGVI